MVQADPLEEKILRRIPPEILAAGAVLGLGAWPFFGALTGLIVFAGAAVAAVGFLWMRNSLTRVLDRTRGRALKSGILIYVARLVLILAVFCLIILFFPRKIFAFAAGFSALLPVFLIEGAVALVRLKTWKS